MFKSKIFVPGLLLSFLFSVNTVYAADYTVMEGDSLWKVSQKFKIPIEQILDLNNLQSDFLSIGQVLHLDNPSQDVVIAAQLTQVTATDQTGWINIGKEEAMKANSTTITAAQAVTAARVANQTKGLICSKTRGYTCCHREKVFRYS